MSGRTVPTVSKAEAKRLAREADQMEAWEREKQRRAAARTPEEVVADACGAELAKQGATIESLAREVQTLRDKLTLAEGREERLATRLRALDSALMHGLGALVLMGEPDWVDRALKKNHNPEGRGDLLVREDVVRVVARMRQHRDAALRDSEVSRG